MTPTFNGIDHVHVYVSDRAAAAIWYRDHLGLKPVEALREWATVSGPLTISDTDNKVHLALFERPQTTGSSSLALGTDGAAFVAWLTYLRGKGLSVRVADHGKAWSMYFSDPDDNQHEITSYDCAPIVASGISPGNGA